MIDGGQHVGQGQKLTKSQLKWLRKKQKKEKRKREQNEEQEGGNEADKLDSAED